MSRIDDLTAARHAIASRSESALSLAEAHLARIEATDATIQAWETLDPAHVRACAERSDAQGCPGVLGGIGIGVKDIIATSDMPTKVGSPIYESFQAENDAFCVACLRNAGAYVFGKTVTSPFAWMDPGKTRNPWNGAHTPGGSSSGSAAAVAAGHVLAAIGSQTNGSVIRPAAYCGVVGFKPTLGIIPVGGMHPFSPTFDTVGVFTRTVRDAACVASVLAEPGRIASDVGSVTHRPRLAWLAAFPWCEPDAATRGTLEAAVDRLRDEAEIVPIGIPAAWREVKAMHRAIMLQEAFEVLGELQGRERARLTDAVNAAIDEGRAITVERYRETCIERERAIAFFTGWLDEYDAVLSPAAPAIAPRGLETTGDPSCCTLWSFLGFPALTLPVGVVDGLPVGLQFAAPQSRDDSLLAAAAWCEARLPFHPLHES
jgi:Asp-tRNA(Asn)/Glu-tRNA(Gln) amidotransferase A subunit family amidase